MKCGCRKVLSSIFALYLVNLLCLLCLLSGAHSIGNIDSKLFELDSSVNDVVWCGTNNESIILLTELSSVYKSDDHGFSWKKLNDILLHTGKDELDENENEIGKVSKLQTSPLDKNIMIFLGTHGINWLTYDCGKEVKALNHGRKIQEFIFHPTEREWGLASAFSLCEDYTDEPCRINKEVYFTKDLGHNWEILASYVVQFGWGVTGEEMIKEGIPRERILLSYEPRGKGHQTNIGWNYKVDFVYSDDFFKTKKVAAHKGNKFLLTKNFLYVAQVLDQADQEVMLLYANPKDNHYNLQPIELSNSKFKEHSYTFLDTSEKTVFIHVNHFGDKSKHGHVYSSDLGGSKFALSIQNNVRLGEGQCDFDRVNGLEGIYLANVIDQEWARTAQQEIFREEAKEETEMSNTTNEKKSKGTISAMEEFRDFIQTFITFNKGGKWHRIKAPERNLEGKRYECGENCYLNLLGISNNSPPFYSVDSAAGILVANGNVGKYLNPNGDDVSTFLSRDGGFTWNEVRKGSHNYEIGDHGAIIILADDNKPVNSISYSWDEGQTWNDLKISNFKMTIRNMIIEPNNISQHFLVYGQTQTKKGEKQGVVIAVDFTGLHKPQCRNPLEPNSSQSDYETWTPNDGRMGHNCLLGKKTIYIRRKSEVECYNGEFLEKKTVVEKCQCTDDDYECDVGYSRKNPSDPCTSNTKIDTEKGKTKEELEKEMYKPPEVCHGFYTVSKGYRRIPGDECEGGVNYDPIMIPCPYSGLYAFLSSLITIIILGLLVGLIYISGVFQKLRDHLSSEPEPQVYRFPSQYPEDDNVLFDDTARLHENTDL